ncbi:MAG: exodeoxyribonuclease V subunit gamma [Myxococcota bacterium]|nr:exodeoxyribonuclease V subunit gamma [Myxococcota bacterium]
MLRAVHSNRVEELFSALDEALPPADPFATSTIIVGSKLVARWLTRELAVSRGIAAGLHLVTFDDFVARTWAGGTEARAAGLSPLDRHRLGAALASVLADEPFVRTLPAVAAYLAAAPAPGDRAGPRRVQLAEHLADLTWSYALTRPDWMPALLAGRAPADLESDPTARWQAALLGAAMSRLERAHAGTPCRWAPLPMLPWLRRRANLPPPKLDAPVAAFGLSFLARGQLEALTDLSATTDVTIYILDPCEELWDDVAGRAARTSITASLDPLPLILWGRPVRDTVAALVERTGGDIEGRFVDELDGALDSFDGEINVDPRTARERLLSDVRARRVPSGAISRDAGVAVLACPNARREIEVIASEARRRLDMDPSLCAHEIAVWIAGDAEQYLAQATSAFEAVGVPCHLIDAPIDDRGRIGEAVLALLELPTGTMTRRELLRVMTHPAVLAAHSHVDAVDWVRWTERLGIVHGADASAHQGTYLEEYPAHFHWDQGVRRLALGAFMVGERAGRGPVTLGNSPFAPEEVRPDQQASAATYALIVRSLCADAAWLAQHEAPLAEWADIFARLVDIYLAPRDEEAKRDIERVRTMMSAIADLDIDGRRIGFREARVHAARRLGTARANRGEPLASGVMIAPLAAMRGVPFRVAFIAGLDEGAFPAGDQPSPLDLRREPRAGDVSPRDRDRAAFLDVLLCTREALFLSYVAVEAKSGQPLGPSSVVLELADALAPYVGAPSSREALAAITTRHPLHRFGESAASSPAVARERWACTVRDELRKHLRAGGHAIPDEDGQLALLAHPSQRALRVALGIEDAPAAPRANDAVARPISIANLRKFLEHPIQAWAQSVLGLYELPDGEVIEHSDEPFHLEAPIRAGVLRDILAEQLRDPSRGFDAIYDGIVRDLQLRGQFPVGVFAAASRTRDLALLATWRDALGLISVGGAMRYGFGRAQSANTELLPALTIELDARRSVRIVGQTELLLRGDRRTSIITSLSKLDKKSPYHLRGALDHLILAAAGISNVGHTHKLVDHEGKLLVVEHTPWTEADARAYLAALLAELLDQPHGYLLPFDGLVKALAGGKQSRTHGDPTSGLGWGPIERRDGLVAPPDANAIALRRLGPIVERMQGDHGFERGPK